MSNQAAGLRYAVRFPVLGKYFGQLCLVVAVLTAVPLLVSLLDGEIPTAVRYGLVICALVALGVLLGRMHAPSNVQVNEAMVLVASMFLFTPLVMTVPVMGSGLSFPDALFETVSGGTTTGLSVLASVEGSSRTFLFARAWMQWYGGLGIVVLSLALLFRPGMTAKRFAFTEAGEEDLVGGTKAHARRVLLVYGLLSGAGIVLLLVAGTDPFEALLYTMAAVSTGGFAPHDGSLAALDGHFVHFAVILVCLAGAVPLGFYHRFYKGVRRPTTDAPQIVGLLVTAALVSLLLGLCMAVPQGWEWNRVVHHAPVLALSAQTTAGFSSIDLTELHASSKLVLILSMAVGGGVGSTAGGLKILRMLILLNLLQVVLRRASASKHAVVTPFLAGHRLDDREVQEALLIILLFVAVILFSWLPFLLMGYDPLDSLFEVVSATGTVGLSVGVAGPELPGLLKGVLCADMLLGRLEILAWLVMVTPGTWIGRRL